MWGWLFMVMDNEITLEDIRRAMKEVHEQCKCEHDYNVGGTCFDCKTIWMGKEERDSVRVILGI